MSDSSDWVDPKELGGLSQSGNILEKMGYDPDEVRMRPELRAKLMEQLSSPYGAAGMAPAGGSMTAQPGTGANSPLRESAPQLAAMQPRPQAMQAAGPASAGSPMATQMGAQTTNPPTPVQPSGTPRTAAQPGPTQQMPSAPGAQRSMPQSGPGPQAALMPQTTGATSAQVAPARVGGSGASQYDDIADQALRKAMGLGESAEQMAKNLGSTTGPETADLEAQRAKDAMPTPYRDPDTGKVLDSAKKAGYKPGIGTEILRGLRGGVVGLMTGGIPGAVVGAIEPQDIRGGTAYGAPDRAYQATEATRTARLGSEDQQLQNVRDQFKAMIESKGKAAGEMRQGVTAYNDVAKQAAELGKQAQTAGNLELHDTEAGPLMINRQTGVAQHVTVDGQPVGPKVQLKESQPLMGADNKPHTYMLDEKGNKVVDLGVHYERPVNVNVGGGGGAPGTPGKTGPEYLASLPPNIAATVKAIGEYREPPPNAGNRSKEAQRLLSAVNQAYPEFKADIWPTLTAARKSFTSSGVGTVVNSFNTALQHLDRLQSNIPLGTGLSTINAVENVFTPSGSKRGLTLGKFDTDANAVSNEVQKAYKGGVVTNDEYRTMMNLLDRNAAPDRIRSNIGELRQLLKGKLDSFRRQYESGLPPGSVIPLETLGLNGPDTRSGAMGAGGAQPAATSGGDNWFTQHPKAK